MTDPALETGPRTGPSGSRDHLLIVTASAELYGSDRSLLNALSAITREFDVTIAFPADGPAVVEAKALGATIAILPDYALRRRNFRSPVMFAKWVARVRDARRQLDRLHQQHPFALIYSNTFASAIGPLLQRTWHRPHVLHVRECPMEPRWQINMLCWLADKGSDSVLCNSNYTKGLLSQVRPALRDRITVVHNGIEMPDLSEAVTPAASGSLRISCVGRIHPKKGQSVLVEAAGIALRAGRRWELNFYGDWLPEHAWIHNNLQAQVSQLGLIGRVNWHGFVTGTDRYSACDVAVVPSVYPEEFSLVCAEAQAMGLPVVATGPGGPSEIIVDGKSGFIVAPNDPQALYDALVKLDDDRAMAAEFGAVGQERTRSTFSLDAYRNGVVGALVAMARPRV